MNQKQYITEANVKHKLLAVILSLAMIITMCPSVVFAVDDGEQSSSSTAVDITENRIIVSNADDLAALGGKEVKGTIELAGNIDMSGTSMEPIQELDGVFEGNGYAIANLSLSGEAGTNAPNLGLIGSLKGEVRNLQVLNVSISTSSIRNVYAGAIAGLIDGENSSLTNCSASGTITLPANSTANYAGGLIGGITGGGPVEVKDCLSEVNVTSGTYPGGMVGALQYSSLAMKNCLVLGTIKVSSAIGNGAGFLGCSTGSNSTMEADGIIFGGTMVGSNKFGLAVLPKYGAAPTKISNAYYDKEKNPDTSLYNQFLTVPSAASGALEGIMDGKTTVELKELELEGFVKDESRDGYPVPAWLTQLADETHSLTVNAADASSVTLENEDGGKIEMTSADDGIFTASVATGTYSYRADTAAADKDAAEGTLLIGKTDKSVVISLPNKLPDTVIHVTPEAAELKVYQGSSDQGTLLEAKSSEEGSFAYALKEGTYYYTVSADEYQTKEGSFTVPVSDNRIDIELSPVEKYEVTFEITCGEQVPTIKLTGGGKVFAPAEEGGMTYQLADGAYQYEVAAPGYITKSGSFQVSGEAETIAVTLEAVKGQGTKENPYQISTKEELVYFAEQVNDGNKDYANAYVELTDDIDLENMSWTPIGSNRTAPFRGHFNGAGHTVSGLNVETARSYYGFFGCLEDAEIKDLTLIGQVYCSEPYSRTGGLAGYAVGDVKITGCASAVNVSVLARGCEGAGGLVGGYEDGVEYKWEDHSMVIENSYNAGNVICTGSDPNTTIGGIVGGNKNCVQLTNCYNTGIIYGPGVQAAGLLGNAGQQTGDNCSPSMNGCYNAGKVVGAEGKEYALYGKGTIAAGNMTNCYAEAETAAGIHSGVTSVVTEADRQKMLEALGNEWTVDPNKNNGFPYLSGREPIPADHTLLDELQKYADVLAIPASAEIGYSPVLLKDGESAAEGITVTCSQSAEDIQKGYLSFDNGSVQLKQKNETGAAITETATLTFEKDGISLRKPVSIVVYPSSQALETLIDRIAATYVNSGDEWVLFDMAAYGQLEGKSYKTSEEARQNYLDLTINALAKDSASANDRAKGEIILGGLRVDTTQLTPYGSQTVYSNGEKLQSLSMNVGYYTAPWILLADEQGNTNLTKAQVQALVKLLTQNQGSNGLCQSAYMGKTYDDVDTTGVALAALARFYFDEEDAYGVKTEVTAFVDQALDGLKHAQGEDGSFGNVNSDAMVITGLAAIGQRPTEFKKNGCSLADALSLYVNSTGNGFTSSYISGDAGEKAQALATEQGFRALVVIERIKDSSDRYNIYTGKINETADPQQPDKEPGVSEGEGNPGGDSGGTTGNPGEPETNLVASFSVKPSETIEWLPATSVTLAQGSTVYDLLNKALTSAGMSCIGAESNYVSAITKGSETLAAGDKGPYSGWMYSVNGTAPNVGIRDYKLKDGDRVTFYYVEDWREEPSTGGWIDTTGQNPVISLTDENGQSGTAFGTAAYDKNSGILTIVPAEGYQVKDVLVNGVSKGAANEIRGLIGLTASDKITVVFEKQAQEPSEAEAEARIKAGVENTTIKLRSTFSKKNNIQLKWTKSKGYKVDYYEVFKSTKRFSGFGTKAYYKTSTGTKNFYINTKELKKGTRYFYKVRGVRVINGEKVYTQWSNKAWRISRVNRK